MKWNFIFLKKLIYRRKKYFEFNRISEEHHKLRLFIIVIRVIFQLWLERNKIILAADIKHIVNSPINLSDSPCRMEQTLNNVHQNSTRTH